MDERSSCRTPLWLSSLGVAALAAGTLLMLESRALAAELTANAVPNLGGYMLAYRGTGFPGGLTVQIVVSDAQGSLPLGGVTAGRDGSFQGTASLHCVPPGYVAQQQARISAVAPGSASPLAASNLSFACLLQH